MTSASQWSGDTAITGFVSQERMRRNLEQRQSTLIWELHHGNRPGTAEPLVLDQYTRTSSRLHVKGVMSPLTIQQNERLETHSTIPSPQIVITAPVSPSSRTSLGPSERDYKRLMDRLERLASARAGGSGREQLKESKPFECILEEGETQFCFANVRRRQIPLRLTIRRLRGKLKTYISKTTPEPSENSYDEVHKSDHIVLSEPGLRFKFPCYYMGFKATEDTSFVVQIAFGRDKAEDEILLRKRQFKSQSSNTNLDELRLDEALKLELNLKVGAIIKHRKSSSAQMMQKDYVEINKRILSPTSPERMTLTSTKSQVHLHRISTAQSRKRENMEIKRQKTLLAINRHRLRLEEEERLRKAKEHLEKELRCSGNWISLLNFAVISWNMLESYRQKKEQIRQMERRTAASIRIQRLVRRKYGRVRGKDLALSQCLSDFRLFEGLVGPLMRVLAGRSVVQHLRATARNNLVQDTFKSFYRRVTLIQHMWRAYVHKDKERWRLLIEQWGKGIEIILKEANEKWPGKKGTKKRQEIMDKYLGLPVSVRNVYLRNSFKSAKLRYREQVREYITRSYHDQTFKAAKAFRWLLMRGAEGEDLVLAPAFVYLPDEETMRLIIEEAVRQNSAPKK